MTELPEYDEVAARERNVREIHEEWNGLRDLSSSGQKSWLTQMKNHYLEIIQADAEAAAELLASHEFHSNLVRKHGLPTSNMKEAT
jgi:hypothetical protein